MKTRSRAGVVSIAALALLGLGTLAESAFATNVNSAQSGCTVEPNTRQRDIDLRPLDLPAPNILQASDETLVVNSWTRYTPTRPQVGQSRHRGRVRFNYVCFNDQGQFVSLGQKTKKLNRNGGAAVSKGVPANQNCRFVIQETSFTGKQKNPGATLQAGFSVSVDESGGCVPDATTLCLLGDRFQVEVDWVDFTGSTGVGAAVPGSDLSGLFYFFNPDSSELLVKLLDACTFDDHFWVFAAATTDVEYTLTVTDTQTGVTKDYFNPLGNPAPAITDTSAFATCP